MSAESCPTPETCPWHLPAEHVMQRTQNTKQRPNMPLLIPFYQFNIPLFYISQ